MRYINPVSANFTKWSDTLKLFVGKLPTNCLSVFDHFVGLAPKGLRRFSLDKIFIRFIFTWIHSGRSEFWYILALLHFRRS